MNRYKYMVKPHTINYPFKIGDRVKYSYEYIDQQYNHPPRPDMKEFLIKRRGTIVDWSEKYLPLVLFDGDSYPAWNLEGLIHE